MKNSFKIAICQMSVVDDKQTNLDKVTAMIKESGDNGADMVVLPEMFNCPYETHKFRAYAESADDSPSLKTVSMAANMNNIYLVAGSIPELLDGNIYNSCFILNRNGEVIDVYRKMHLFDVDIPGMIFNESETVTAGNKITVVDTDLTHIGIGICYDIRFPELFRIMTLKKAGLMIVPGAFNMKTGPAHWETLIRARAIDNQVYMVVASPAPNEDLSYVAYGHSLIVDPWGKILCEAGENEEIIYATIDTSYTDKIREELPILKNRRTDIYKLIEINNKKIK
ncbi:MAG: carbon-nitrogen hydrolase family protein [Methanobacterium sp.]|uniref:carbon-nitrogen hydrolase family protein n=3 Tax=Methanobacterium sp. TaxID=2164 RepID=UPI003C76045D